MDGRFDGRLSRYGDSKLMGTREVLGEEDEMQASGKMFSKLELGEYRWLTYNQVSSFGVLQK